MYQGEVPSGEMSLLKGLAAQVSPAFNPDRGNKSQLTGSVVEKIAVQAKSDFRDRKLDGLKENLEPDTYGGEKGYEEVAKARQDKICEAIAIMRMAASESTWLKMRPDKEVGGEIKPGSKSREQIIDTVCKAILGDSIAGYDFDDLYGAQFAGKEGDSPSDEYNQLNMSPSRRILLIKATEQFLVYAQEHPEDVTAQKRVAQALNAIDRLAAGNLNPRLDKEHSGHARTEAASILASRDIIQHRKALESYFAEKSIKQADKLQVVMDLEITNMGQAVELARMIRGLCEKGISPKLQFALVSKVEDGLNKSPTPEDILRIKSLVDRRLPEQYVREEMPNAKVNLLKEISFHVLSAQYSTDQAATQALLVMSRAFDSNPAFAVAKDTHDNRHDELRGTDIDAFSPSVIKAIPAFLLEKHPLSQSEKDFSIESTTFFESKRKMDESQVNLAIALIMQGLNEFGSSTHFGPYKEEQEKLAVYLEMLVTLKQKLPKDQREKITFSDNQLSYVISRGGRYDQKVGNRISRARQRLTAG